MYYKRKLWRKVVTSGKSPDIVPCVTHDLFFILFGNLTIISYIARPIKGGSPLPRRTYVIRFFVWMCHTLLRLDVPCAPVRKKGAVVKGGE